MSEKPHLLLVDDERSIREPLAQYLSRNGFRVTAVDSAAEARIRLNACGVSAVYGGGLCTYTDAARFYSYRRDGTTGRMATLIWLA